MSQQHEQSGQTPVRFSAPRFESGISAEWLIRTPSRDVPPSMNERALVATPPTGGEPAGRGYAGVGIHCVIMEFLWLEPRGVGNGR